MEKNSFSLFIVCLAIFVSSCGMSRISAGPPMQVRIDNPIKSIAMAPSGGLLADAIAVELANRGYQVIDTAQTSQLLVRVNLNELESNQPQALSRLKERGIDAYLSARAVGGYDSRPQSVVVRLNGTSDGRILTGFSWQNGWGGMGGSMADRTMRKEIAQAAE